MRIIKKISWILPLIIILNIPYNTYCQRDSGNTANLSQQAQSPESSQSTQTTQEVKPVRILAKPFVDSGKIEQQFNYLIEKSNLFQEYRVIKLSWISTFRNRLTDSLKNLRGNIYTNRTLLEEKSNLIDSLNLQLKTTNEKLTTALTEKNSFRFLGILVSKTTYDAIMWVLIFVLLSALVFLFLLYKRSFIVISQAKKDLDETRNEFEDFRKKALKSKEDAVRVIFDELKKYKK